MPPLSAILAALGRLARVAALWLAACVGAQAAPSPTLNAEDVFHIYFVDVGAAASRAPDVMNYILERWNGLADGPTGRGQNGVLILVHGPRGQTRTLTLDGDRARQADAIKHLLDAEVTAHDPRSPAGIELNEAARLIGDEVQRMLARAVGDFQARNAVRGRFVVMHLIAEQLLFRSTDHGMATVLSRHDQPDRCFAGDVMSKAIADYPRQVKAALPDSPPVALRGALVLVAAGDARFPPAAERAAALRLLGGAAVARQAVAMRDALRCLETDSGIPIDSIDEAPCRPGGPGAAAPMPERSAASCVDITRWDTEGQRRQVQNARLTDLIAPVARGADVLAAVPGSPATVPMPRVPAPISPAPPPSTPLPSTPGSSAPDLATPGPAAPSLPSPNLPAPSLPAPTPPASSPPAPTPPAAGAPALPPEPRPPLAPTPAPVATPETPRDEGKLVLGPSGPLPPPAKPAPQTPEPESPLAAVSQVVSLLGRPASMPPAAKAIHVDISINEPLLQVLLVPAGSPPTADVAEGALDITRGTFRRQSPGGDFALVARLAPGARCPGPSPLDFDVTLYGFAIPDPAAGRYRVRMLDACSPQGVVAVFGQVRLQ